MTLDFRDLFDEISDIFQSSQQWTEMENCVENSPWHREENVAVHTKMVVSEYVFFTPIDWREADFIGAVAVLFHDVGKPASKIEKFSESRGKYFAFHGHEQVSARMFVDFVFSTPRMKEIFTSLNKNVLFAIAWIIENHIPWSITDTDKRDRLFRTVHQYLGDDEVYMNVLLADTYGRISDDAEEKRAKSEAWCSEFRSAYSAKRDYFDYLFSVKSDKPTAYVFIGASGSGKSTFKSEIFKRHDVVNVFSLDDMRTRLYGDDYGFAFQQSTKDNYFKPQCQAEFLSLARANKTMIIDNTNTTKKSRAMYVSELKARKYEVVAVVFMTALKTVIDRQTTRSDKTVPRDAVERQYMGVQLPALGEFDKIEIVFGE